MINENNHNIDMDNPSEGENNASRPSSAGDQGQIATDNILRTAANELLKQLQEPEPWPEDLLNSDETSHQTPDIYTLIESLTALRQEISLQGRGFNQLQQTVESVLKRTDCMKSIDEKLLLMDDGFSELRSYVEHLYSQSLMDERNAGRKEGREQAFDSLIEPLLDTHDQLRRLVENNRLRIKTKGWRKLFSKKESKAEILQTVELSHKKITQRLSELGVLDCARIGAVFNPKTMKAVEIVESNKSAENTVVDIFRQGYEVDERVIRFAEVKVTSSSPENSEN